MMDLRNKERDKKNDVIEFDEGISLAKSTGCVAYIETSALDGTNVQEMMMMAITASCCQKLQDQQVTACNLQ